MNFLCENCKQKYHVADEKLRGREVTKFKCKKCEHIIEVRGDAVGAGDDAEAGSASILSSVPPPSAAAPVAPRPAVAAKPTGTGLPVAGAPKPAVAPVAKPTGTGLPTAGAAKPIGTGFPAAKPATSSLPTAGAPKPATTGGLPTSAPRATATTAARPTGTSLPTAGSAARVASPATASPSPAGVTALKPAATPAAKPAAHPSALRSSITQASHEPSGPKRTTSSASTSALLNPSETGWYAGIREVPVGPLTRAELATKIDSGDITTDTLVWREGLDDWRPLSAVNELSDLLREASKRVSDTMLGAQAKKSTSNVVPLSRANPQKDLEEPEESTRLTSLSDLIATAEGSALKKPAAKSEPPQEIRHEPKPEPKREAKAPAQEFKSEPKHEPKAEPKSEPATVPAVSQPASDLDDPFFMGAPKKAPAAAVAAPAATAAPAVKSDPNPYGLPLVAATPAATAAAPAAKATLPSIPPPKEEKKSGVPMGMVVMFGGMLVLVGGGGLYAGTRINNQQQPVQQPTVQQPAQTPTPPTPRLDPHVGAQVNLNADPTQQQPAANTPTTNPQPAGAHTATGSPTGSHATGGSHPTARSNATSTGTGPSTTGLTADQIRQMQAQLNTAPSGVTGTAGGPVGTRQNTAPTQSSEPVSGPTGSVRAAQVLETYRRTNVVGSCWQQQITRNPAHPPERINVTLTVSPTGRATAVNVAGANDPALSSCIQSRSRSQNFGPGGQVDAQASFNLAIGN